MLQVNDLNVFYGGVHALKGLTLQVPKGMVVTLIGANGAGKKAPAAADYRLGQGPKGANPLSRTRLTTSNPTPAYPWGSPMDADGRRVFLPT